jgi:hypothetical protein
VWPGIKPELLNDRLTRANERLKVIFEVEQIAQRVEKLEEQFRTIKEI